MAAQLPPVQVLLVPYLENSANGVVATEKPHDKEPLHSSSLTTPQGALLAFAVKDAEVADVHYRFYRAIAELIAGPKPEAVPGEYVELLRQEFAASAHGEVDDAAWRLKSELSPADLGARKTKRFKAYARASFVDTLTLYLHGICCDIDAIPAQGNWRAICCAGGFAISAASTRHPRATAVLPEDEKNL